VKLYFFVCYYSVSPTTRRNYFNFSRLILVAIWFDRKELRIDIYYLAGSRNKYALCSITVLIA
jgi:hypothetical protein